MQRGMNGSRPVLRAVAHTETYSQIWLPSLPPCIAETMPYLGQGLLRNSNADIRMLFFKFVRQSACSYAEIFMWRAGGVDVYMGNRKTWMQNTTNTARTIALASTCCWAWLILSANFAPRKFLTMGCCSFSLSFTFSPSLYVFTLYSLVTTLLCFSLASTGRPLASRASPAFRIYRCAMSFAFRRTS